MGFLDLGPRDETLAPRDQALAVDLALDFLDFEMDQPDRVVPFGRRGLHAPLALTRDQVLYSIQSTCSICSAIISLILVPVRNPCDQC